MRIYTINHKLNKVNKYILWEEQLNPEAKELKERLEYCSFLRSKKVLWNKIKEIVKISRSNYYRIKKKVKNCGYSGYIKESRRPQKIRERIFYREYNKIILRLRIENPSYGKEKLQTILRRDHSIIISSSSVGRIIKKLKSLGKIEHSASYCRKKRARRFKGHAKRWSYGMKPEKPGEMMQLDHMTVSKYSVTMKHFGAWDPVSKYCYADIFSVAKAKSAKQFLLNLIREAPFKISSIQVDGGSEFMAEFEETCKNLGIALYVIPPKRPQYNGGVERSNRTFREEFYSQKIIASSIFDFRIALEKAVNKYNSYRPHKSLDYLTPLEYIQKITRPIQSIML